MSPAASDCVRELIHDECNIIFFDIEVVTKPKLTMMNENESPIPFPVSSCRKSWLVASAIQLGWAERLG